MNPLSDEYLPEEVLHREEQFKEVCDCFENFSNSGCGSQSLAVLGVTGSGKSTLIRKAIGDRGNVVYVNCAETKSAVKVLKKICGTNRKTHSDMLEDTLNFLKENPKVIVLDEADKIKDIVDLMVDLNVIYRRLMIPVILVTLKRDIIEKFPSDIRKTFFFQKVNLPAYNAIELQDILRSRLKIANMDVKELDSGKIAYISAIAAKQGSARVLINITLRCLQKKNFTQEFIEDVYEQIMKEDWLNFVNEVNDSEKAFLKFLLENCDWSKEISSEDIQKNINQGKFTAARISQLVNTFERYSVVRSRHQNLGRGGGRKRMVRFVSEEVFKELNKIWGYDCQE